MKLCKDCKINKEISEFSTSNSGRSTQPYCRLCACIRSKKWRMSLSEERLAINRKKKLENWHRNSERILRDKREARKLNLNFKEREWYRNYAKKKRDTDPNYKIKMNLRHRIYLVLKGGLKSDTTVNLLGCSIADLKDHLSLCFTSGMSWDNYGEWHIDHIKPCASFDLTKESEQKKCFHYSNLQPLWAVDNLRKGGR